MHNKSVGPVSKPKQPKLRPESEIDFEILHCDANELFKNFGIEKNLKEHDHYLMKRADIQQEMVPEVFPFELVPDKPLHFITMTTKHAIENVTVLKRCEYVDVFYYMKNSEPIKISIKESEEDGHEYQFYLTDELKEEFSKKGHNVHVAVNQIVQMVAVMVGFIVENYALKYTWFNLKLRGKNNFKHVDLKIMSRPYSLNLNDVYPFYHRIDWDALFHVWEESNQLDILKKDSDECPRQ